MVQQIQQRTQSSHLNDSLTRWTAEQQSREMQHQVDKLIESAKEELNKQECSSPVKAARTERSILPPASLSAAPLPTTPLLTTPLSESLNSPYLIADATRIKTVQSAQNAQKAAQTAPRKQIEEVMGMAAAKIARDIDANCVISMERKGVDSGDKDHLNVQVSIFRKLEGTKFEKMEYPTKMRKVMNGSVVPIKELLMEAINRKYIDKGDRIVCVEDESVGMGYKGLLFIFDVDKIFFNISVLNMAGTINPDVIESVVNIALELSKEGREGKHIGTAFVIGNTEELKPFIKQMILNPYQSCCDSDRKINEMNNKETVKNFAQLDGVFVVDPTGLITNAGAYINVDAANVELPSGYGTRHRNSAAITKVTDSIAVVVSSSGGIISVFKGGKLVTRLS